MFYGEEFKERSAAATSFEYGHPNPGGGGRYTSYFGMDDPWSRLIFVNLRQGGGKKHKKRGLREIRETLVHELVHYRFAYMSHGETFEKRVKDILRGKQYPRKHIDIPNYEGRSALICFSKILENGRAAAKARYSP